MYLLDTNVVSELRKVGAGKADPSVTAWQKTIQADQIFVSAMTVFELQIGVLLLERRDPRQAAAFRKWLDQLIATAFYGRILPIDLAVATRAAELHVPNRRPDRDTFIAATALVHGMTMVTRNVADFAGTGVRVLNPWEPGLA
jgi:toxin FitB